MDINEEKLALPEIIDDAQDDLFLNNAKQEFMPFFKNDASVSFHHLAQLISAIN